MLALHAWNLTCQPGLRRFRAALGHPQHAQVMRMRSYGFVDGNALRTLPLTTWDDVAPQVDRMRQTGVGATRLVPTSGSSAIRKLIPWTPELGQEFGAAIAAWIGDTYARQPALMDGVAYWSITPPPSSFTESSAIPIGFDDDSAYLGGRWSALVSSTFAVDAARIRAAGEVGFLDETCRGLLLADNLRLISAWHPSLVEVLLNRMHQRREELMLTLPRGQRRRDLERIDWQDVTSLWPELRLVSCWADGPAKAAGESLAARMPGVHLQAKGLLATEGVVSIPFAGTHPLAITSHVYEFRDDDGICWWPHEVAVGQEYEVILTTGGHLRRYCLGDRVLVTEMLGATPCLRFLRRQNAVSDLAGEKLDETVIAHLLSQALPKSAGVALQPRADHAGYRLVVPSDSRLDARTAAVAMESQLLTVHHYALARTLEQLQPLEAYLVSETSAEILMLLAAWRRQRLGDVKPSVWLPAEFQLQRRSS